MQYYSLKDSLHYSGFKKLTISVPTYNEEGNLRTMINECLNILGDDDEFLEIIIVDDCSSDGSFEIATELSTYSNVIKVIKNEENVGCHPSQIIGWNNSEGDLLYVLPSDNQIPPNSIFELIQNMKNNDIVWTNRALRKDNFLRKLISGIYNFISKKFFKIYSSDIDSAVMISKKKYLEVAQFVDSKSAFIQVQLGFASSLAKFNQTEVIIPHRSRLYGQAKGINLHDVLWVPLELIRLLRKRRIVKQKIISS